MVIEIVTTITVDGRPGTNSPGRSKPHGSTALRGALGLGAYGYNGLDDGAVMRKMPAVMITNIGEGLAFFKSVASMLKGKSR